MSIVALVALPSLPAGLDAQDFAGVEAVALKEMAQAPGAAIAIVHGRRRCSRPGGDFAFAAPAGVRLVFVADSSGPITFPTSGGRSWRRMR